jgi:hypothetical protein
MAAREELKRRSLMRDGELFIMLPFTVVDSDAYRALSHPARSLLIDMARQLRSDRENNGQLLASRAHLRKVGWNSADVIHRAKNELSTRGFIFETVKGRRPNKASWYAVTWHPLPRNPKYDFEAQANFVRSAYKRAPAGDASPLTANSVRRSPGGDGSPEREKGKRAPLSVSRTAVARIGPRAGSVVAT